VSGNGNGGVPAGGGHSPPPDRNSAEVDSVREELVRLGYLTSGVDRYFLDDIGAGRGALRRVFRGAARGAFLLGAPLAVGFATILLARNPGAGASPFDGVALFLYLIVPAFFSAWLALVAAGLAGVLVFGLSRFRPDPSLLARSISTLFSFAGSVAAVAACGAARGEVVWFFVRLLLVATAGFVAERIFYDELLALFVAVEGVAPRRRRASPLRLAGILIAVTVAAGGISALFDSGPTPSGPASPLIVKPISGRVVVIAIDGYDEETVRHLSEEGAISALPGLEKSGVRFRYSRASSPPPEVWTTFWTGVSPERHGMRAYDWVRPRGVGRVLHDFAGRGWYFRRVLAGLKMAEIGAATATERTAAALWEITARAGYPTLQVANWGSGPSTPLLGRSISNRAPLRLLHKENAEGEVYPASLLPRLSVAASRIPTSASDAEWLDAWEMELSAGLWDEGQEKLAVVYLPGLDLIRNPVGAGATEKDLLVRAEALRREYVAIDRFVSHMTRESADGKPTSVVIVGDPGRSGEKQVRGVVLIRGLGIEKGSDSCAPVDLLPTILAGLGIPLSDELAGKAAGAPVQNTGTVERYDRPASAAGSKEKKFDSEQYLKELRSLGYIR